MNANDNNWLDVPASAANLNFPVSTFIPNYTTTASTFQTLGCHSLSGSAITASIVTKSAETLTLTSDTSASTLKLQTSTSAAPNSTQILQLGNTTAISRTNAGFTLQNPSIILGSLGSPFKALFMDNYYMAQSGTNNFTQTKSFLVPAGITLGTTHQLFLHVDKTQDPGYSDAFVFTFNPVTLTGNPGVGYSLVYSFQILRVDSNSGWGSLTFSLSFLWINS